MTPVRRSGRTRQKARSIYDDAKKVLEESQKENEDREEMNEAEDSSEDPDGSEEESSDDHEDSDIDDNHDEGKHSKRARTPKKSPSSRANGNSSRKIQVHIKPSKRRRSQKLDQSRSTSKKPVGQKSIRNALMMLANKVLPQKEIEEPQKSLVASLLLNDKMPESDLDHINYYLSYPPTSYTPHLHSIAKNLINLHNVDPNKAQIRLINLLFRSIGGTAETDLREEETQLEDMGNEEWGQNVTDLVDEMRHTSLDSVLFCSDPDGAVHYNALKNAMDRDEKVSIRDIGVTGGSLGVREYRKIYEEFWYVLGHVALVEGGMGSTASATFMEHGIEDSSESEDEEGDLTKTPLRGKTSNDTREGGLDSTAQRFDTEIIRVILSRIVELVTAGQPDVRAASTSAVLSLSLSILDETVYLNDKLKIAERQFEAAGASKGGKETSSKAKSLKYQIDSLKRTRANLEEIVETLVIKGVFIHRYRDSNMFIRATSIQALDEMVVRRPDLFLKDKYLKYFGWMLSDKAECVRIAALRAMNRPFELWQDAEKNGTEHKIELSLLVNVIAKFLARIADTAIDVHSSVQELGVRLMLSLLRTGFLDETGDNDIIWDQVNNLAFETNSTPEVRRDALYFIMEQLEEFDDGDEEEIESSKKRKSSGSAKTSDRSTAQRLDAIASWAAHVLTNGNVPIDKIKIELVDHLVQSLRLMPEHKSLVTNWTAMIRAITDEKVAMTSQGVSAGDRADLAKQRVLVKMLTSAAKAEVESVTDADFLHSDLDPAEIDILQKSIASRERIQGGRRSSTSKTLNHEALSVALVKALPNLLEKFKSDSMILASLVSLPRYFVPSVFSLPQRKADFLSLLKSLTSIYLLSTDEDVLQNVARSIVFLSEGGHARSNEAKASVKKILAEIRDRIICHLSEKVGDADEIGESRRKSPRKLSRHRRKSPRGKAGEVPADLCNEEIKDNGSRAIDHEAALYLCLKRARILALRCTCIEYLDDDTDSAEGLCNRIADGLSFRLDSYRVHQAEDDGKAGKKSKGTGWRTSEEHLCRLIAGIVDEGLHFILAVTAQKLCFIEDQHGLILDDDEDNITENEDKEDDGDGVNDHVVLRLRNRLVSLVEESFQQFLPLLHDPDAYNGTQRLWADLVQKSACDVVSDLRTMLPKEWSNSSSSVLRGLAITEDSNLIGGLVRYITSVKEEKRRGIINEKVAERSIASLIKPLGRAVAVNWTLGNRREAGVALSHICGSGTEVAGVVTTLSKLLKQIQPVRFLEAQMASLRLCYEDWIDSEPSDLDMDDDNVTDITMENFEEKEANHLKQFEEIVQMAERFSLSLGARKLSDEENLSPALIGFVKEGIRFSFSTSVDHYLGSRLSFFGIMIKYASWIKKDDMHRSTVQEFLEEKEVELRAHKDFKEVHPDDLAALVEFRTALGLSESIILSADALDIEDESIRSIATPHSGPASSNKDLSTHVEDDECRDGVNALSITTPATSAARKSRTSTSVGSVRSMLSSVRSSLSPLYEENSVGSKSTPSKKFERSRFEGSDVSGAFNKQINLESSDVSPTSYSKSSPQYERLDEEDSKASKSTHSYRAKRSRSDDSVVSGAASKQRRFGSREESQSSALTSSLQYEKKDSVESRPASSTDSYISSVAPGSRDVTPTSFSRTQSTFDGENTE